MRNLRPAQERGRADFGWLDSRHTFSFGDYYDPRHMGFSALRVINDDRVAPGRGFGAHSHRDMEILSYVLEGSLEHKDSMGNGSILERGRIQLMSAGSGVTHSEFNPSRVEPVHFLQIWIVPDRRGEAPGYQETHFDALPARGQFRLVASPEGGDGALGIKQDARVFAARLDAGARASFQLPEGRSAWVHVAEGKLRLDGQELQSGDGLAIRDERELAFESDEASELLVFDLPSA